MTDIVSHIVTIGFGLLLFFAVLYELVLAFKRNKKVWTSDVTHTKAVRTYNKACAVSGSDYSGIYKRTKDGMEKIAELNGVPVNRGQPDKRTQEASEQMTLENLEAVVKDELKRMEDWGK